jgi:hypothetical protein
MTVLQPGCDHMSRPTRRLELIGQKLKGVSSIAEALPNLSRFTNLFYSFIMSS